jgi:glutamate 5-kinase
MITKLRAAKIAAEAGIETLIIGGGGTGLEMLAKGQINGTRILAKDNLSTRKAWLSQQKTKGNISIDAGAYKALQNGRSLLPSGITSIEGKFEFGDAVAINYQETVVAHGLSNYSNEALVRIKGKKSSEIETILGYKDFDEVIHRDNLVLLET